MICALFFVCYVNDLRVLFCHCYISAIYPLNNRHLALVVQTLNRAMHQVKHYPADKYFGKQSRHPLSAVFLLSHYKGLCSQV